METVGASLVGYQVRFTPAPPWKLGRVPAETMGARAAPDSVVVARLLPGGVKNVLIAPGKAVEARECERSSEGPLRVLRLRSEGTSFTLGAGVEDLSEIGSAAHSSAASGWRLETRSYTVDWPEGYSVATPEEGATFPFMFERVGGPNEMIILRGPLVGSKQVPSPQALIGKGQEPVAMDMRSPTPWVELRYWADGKPWRQRQYYAVLKPETIVLVTVQGPEERAEQLAIVGDRVAASVKPRGTP